MTETLRERVRERLGQITHNWAVDTLGAKYVLANDLDVLSEAILREFRLQPVAVGKVTGEGEVEGL